MIATLPANRCDIVDFLPRCFVSLPVVEALSTQPHLTRIFAPLALIDLALARAMT
jgi:hypothetical protein